MRPLLFGSAALSFFPSLAGSTDIPAAEQVRPLLRIEILRTENQYVSENGFREMKVVWKTSEAALYQIRRGYNCRTGEPVDKVNYSGITTAEKENTLRISASVLKPGLNTMVICINRAPLAAASSQDLDYGTDVYEKNLTAILDEAPPVTVADIEDTGAKAKILRLRCYDEGACETIFYSLQGNGRSENFQQKSNTAAVPLGKEHDWIESVRYSSADRAGNREAAHEIKINADRYSWFGNGRLAVTPAFFFRLNSANLLPGSGWSAGMSADLPLARLLEIKQTTYLPALRLEGHLLSFQNNTNTQDNAGSVTAGATWLYPVKKGTAGAFSGGITAGAARYFRIVSARDVTTMLAFAASAFAGYEFTFNNFYFFSHWRLWHIAATDPVWAHGPAVGAGIIF